MKKGEIYEGIVDDLDFPNKGILLIDGERVSVKNALPEIGRASCRERV